MFIWNFKIETKWTFHSNDDGGDEENYTVAGENFDKAWLKVQKLTLAKSRTWKDTDDNGVEHKWSPISTEIIEVSRGDWLDG